MKLFFLFFALLALALADEPTAAADQPVAADAADGDNTVDEQQIANTDNQVVAIDEPSTRTDDPVVQINEPEAQADAGQSNIVGGIVGGVADTAPIVAKGVPVPNPYPFLRQAYPLLPYQIPHPEYFREQQPLIQYVAVPVYVQQQQQPADDPNALSRQITANAGAHLGPFGIGFGAGASPSGIGANFGAGVGSAYTGYSRPTYHYPSYTTYYPYGYRSLPAQQRQQQPEFFHIF